MTEWTRGREEGRRICQPSTLKAAALALLLAVPQLPQAGHTLIRPHVEENGLQAQQGIHPRIQGRDSVVGVILCDAGRRGRWEFGLRLWGSS